MHLPLQLIVGPLDHRSTPVAQEIHALQMAAYAKEAALIGARHFPPLDRTLAALRSSPEQFLGVHAGSELVAAAGIEPGELEGTDIASFVVAPGLHRRGVGRTLLHRIVELHGHGEIRVSTAALNGPAIALYRGAGFLAVGSQCVGAEALELVVLSRAAQPAPRA